MESTIAMAAFGSPWQLIIIALLIILIFGTKKLRSLGSDLGESLKGFKKAMSDDEKAKLSKISKMPTLRLRTLLNNRLLKKRKPS